MTFSVFRDAMYRPLPRVLPKRFHFADLRLLLLLKCKGIHPKKQDNSTQSVDEEDFGIRVNMCELSLGFG